MLLAEKIKLIQTELKNREIDGWLLYDFRCNNPLAHEWLELEPTLHFTRRFFYWIPNKGEPVLLSHEIEKHLFHLLPGKKQSYRSWDSLQESLHQILVNVRSIAMEYVPFCSIPEFSLVDGGTLDGIRDKGIRIVSSAPLLSLFIARWNQEQFQTHIQAAHVLEEVAFLTWNFLRESFLKKRVLTEFEVQQWMHQEIVKRDCVMEGFPICAVQKNTANPHYMPGANQSSVIQEGDLILIDLWCRKKKSGSMYADITRMGFAGPTIPSFYQEIFDHVRHAQKSVTQWIADHLKQEKIVLGCEADRFCRARIEEAGFGDAFLHRTGHNIHTTPHGPGTHLDSLETIDERPLMTRSCYSVEPGIYLSGQFGVRLEYDIYLHETGSLQITGGIQEEIERLLT
jgi:Xaa-Pro dipeptidase